MEIEFFWGLLSYERAHFQQLRFDSRSFVISTILEDLEVNREEMWNEYDEKIFSFRSYSVI